MTTSDFTKNDTPKFIFYARKKAPQKMEHPVPAYMVINSPSSVSLRDFLENIIQNFLMEKGTDLNQVNYKTHLNMSTVEKRICQYYCHDINSLQKLQNRTARIVTNSAYDASALPIIRKLDGPP